MYSTVCVNVTPHKFLVFQIFNNFPDVLFQFNLAIPIIFLMFVLFLLILPLKEEPQSTVMAVVVILSGLPVYVLGVKWKSKPKSFQRFVGEYSTVSQEPQCARFSRVFTSSPIV